MAHIQQILCFNENHGLVVEPDFGSVLSGCSSAWQGVPAVQRQGEEAAEWTGSCDRPTPPPGATEHGAQDGTGPTRQQAPPTTGEQSINEMSRKDNLTELKYNGWGHVSTIILDIKAVLNKRSPTDLLCTTCSAINSRRTELETEHQQLKMDNTSNVKEK